MTTIWANDKSDSDLTANAQKVSLTTKIIQLEKMTTSTLNMIKTHIKPIAAYTNTLSQGPFCFFRIRKVKFSLARIYSYFLYTRHLDLRDETNFCFRDTCL